MTQASGSPCWPTSSTSLPFGSMLRIVAKMSTSFAVLETQMLSTTGPVTSMSSFIGGVSKEIPRGILPGREGALWP
ncbi:hypothetical protein D3C83_35210 [compost metagenome]